MVMLAWRHHAGGKRQQEQLLYLQSVLVVQLWVGPVGLALCVAPLAGPGALLV